MSRLNGLDVKMELDVHRECVAGTSKRAPEGYTRVLELGKRLNDRAQINKPSAQ